MKLGQKSLSDIINSPLKALYKKKKKFNKNLTILSVVVLNIINF